MDGQQNLEAIMGLIMYSGNVKSDAMEVTTTAKSGGLRLAGREIADIEESLVHACHSQTEMLTEEAKGNNMQIMLLTVHSQDYLATTIALTDLAEEIIGLYCRIDSE